MSQPLTRTDKAGLPPGTLLYSGPGRTGPVSLRVLDFSPDSFDEFEGLAAEDCLRFKGSSSTTWIQVEGVHDTRVVEKLGAIFGLNPFAQEDVVTLGQRPKVEVFEDHLFLEMLVPFLDDHTADLRLEQVSFVVGRQFLLTFHEQPPQLLAVLKTRLQDKQARARQRGPDYLAYRVIDVLVDQFFVVLEEIGDRIEDLEEEVLERPSQAALRKIFHLKSALITLRRAVWPTREVMGTLVRGDAAFSDRDTRAGLRDVYDHIVQVAETLENQRDLIVGIHDLYLNGLNNRLNEVMRFLTAVTTIFMPLSFIAGVYGMNLKLIPDDRSYFGFALVLGAMVAVGIGMYLLFRRRRWL